MERLYDLSNLNEKELQAASISEIQKGFVYFDKFAHKGTRGHTAIIAGSYGMMGAAILAASAANRSGTGKTTVYVPNDQFSLIHQSIPEVLVKEANPNYIDIQMFNSIGIGPGIGLSQDAVSMMKRILLQNRPLVIDADALNIIAQNKEMLYDIPKGSVLTPHIKEWERLFGNAETDTDRIQKTLEFARKSGVFIILKGHFSCLVTPDQEVHFNGTGNSGMAKGGSGDVLTGLLSGLLSQGFTVKCAALTAMYIHGLAGDLAKEDLGEESMTASDQINYFSHAFSFLRQKLENER